MGRLLPSIKMLGKSTAGTKSDSGCGRKGSFGGGLESIRSAMAANGRKMRMVISRSNNGKYSQNLSVVSSQPLPGSLSVVDSQPIQQSEQASPTNSSNIWERMGPSIPSSPYPIPQTREEAAALQTAARQQAPAMGAAIGATVAPELLPEEAGVIASSLAAGAGAGVGTMAGHGAVGENPVSGQNLKEAGENAVGTALTAGAIQGAGKALGWGADAAFGSKLSRGMVNESVGATARDVTYGNPAKALMDENITTPITGDIEKYKAGLRAGLPPDQALIDAGGRIGAVTQRIQQLAPQVDTALKASTAQIPVADVIDKPLDDALTSIINNRAMTQAEKDAAIGQIGALQQSLKEGLPSQITPLQANQIKQAIGSRVNWAGNIAVTDEVRPAYKAVYGALKNSVNGAVPSVAQINERLTNLLTAQTDLEKLMKAEEVGQGKGALGSAVTGIARRLEAIAGRGIPAARNMAGARKGAFPLSGRAAAGAVWHPSQLSVAPIPSLQTLLNGGNQ